MPFIKWIRKVFGAKPKPVFTTQEKKIMRELNERYERESSLHHLNNPIIDRIAELLLASKDARKILTEVIDESLEIKNKEIKNKPQAPAPGSH